MCPLNHQWDLRKVCLGHLDPWGNNGYFKEDSPRSRGYSELDHGKTVRRKTRKVNALIVGATLVKQFCVFIYMYFFWFPESSLHLVMLGKTLVADLVA